MCLLFQTVIYAHTRRIRRDGEGGGEEEGGRETKKDERLKKEGEGKKGN